MKVKTKVQNIRAMKFPKAILQAGRVILVPIDWEIEGYDPDNFASMDFVAEVPELRTPLVLDFTDLNQPHKETK